MFGDSANWFLVSAGFIFIVAELFVGVDVGFDMVLIGLSFLAGGVLGNIFNQPIVGIGAATILCFLYVIIGRRFIKSRILVTTHRTNIDSICGKTGFVIKPISARKKGQVVVDGEIWLAESESKMFEGDKIEVISIEGVTLRVIKRGGDK